jgi:hypothetical protein
MQYDTVCQFQVSILNGAYIEQESKMLNGISRIRIGGRSGQCHSDGFWRKK